MPQALITLNENTNRVLNVIKAKHSLKDKSAAVEFLVEKFVDDSDDLELRPEFIAKIKRREKGPFIRIDNFAERYKVSSRSASKARKNV